MRAEINKQECEVTITHFAGEFDLREWWGNAILLEPCPIKLFTKDTLYKYRGPLRNDGIIYLGEVWVKPTKINDKGKITQIFFIGDSTPVAEDTN